MIILGISEEHDSGVALLDNGEIIFCANEERYNRKKHSGGFPEKSLQKLREFIEESDKKEWNISAIAIGSLIHVRHGAPDSYGPQQKIHYNLLTSIIRKLSKLSLGRWALNSRFVASLLRFIVPNLQRGRKKKLVGLISETLGQDLSQVNAVLVDHHISHAYSAYFTSGFRDSLVLTFDAQGDGICSRVLLCKNGKIRELKNQPFFSSVGYYYTIVTVILGFKGGQEGKVTGLSACGKPDKVYKILKERISYNEKTLKFKNSGLYYIDEIDYLKNSLSDFSREDIAAGVQFLLENYVCSYLEDIIVKFNITSTDLCLAGGIFANVLLNNRLSKLTNIKKIFVHPNMGDGGLPLGAAFYLSNRIKPGLVSQQLDSVYLGSAYTDDYIQSLLDEYQIQYQAESNIEDIAGELLSKGNILCVFQGRMEYGPRALGNRSIIAKADLSSINDKLNGKLQRSEFMPFAPSVLEEYASDYFALNESNLLASEFMTMVVDCREKCKEVAPGIVHIDGTARPHIVKKEINTRYHKILRAFYERTGVALVLNTSFNMHDEPIVESPEDALRAFKRSNIDYLLLGSFLISQKDVEHTCMQGA